EVVPPENLERRQVVPVRRAREMGKGDLPAIALAVIGNEEEIIGGPCRTIGAVCGGALLERHVAEDAAQRHNRQPFRFEFDEEDAPGLVGRERSQTFYALNLDRRLRIDAKLIGCELEKQIV